MKKLLQQKPPYPIASVDNALRLLQLLRDGGSIRLTDAAGELGIAESSAHRLMAMLVYRGFAVQGEGRKYIAGPALGVRAIGVPWLHDLRHLAQDSMQVLASELDETVNLVVRVGANIRFLATVEGRAVLRVGDRTGTVMPAVGASSGKALLAYESPERVESLYTGRAAEAAGSALAPAKFRRLVRELETVRRDGYALSRGETEEGVGAIGVVILDAGQRPVAGLSVATPIARLERLLEPQQLRHIYACREAISTLASTLPTEAA